MDEEDLAEHGESQTLETQDAFAGLGTAKDRAAKGMFSDLFKTAGETMGVKLLQRMGWRPGQGIGPKVRRRAQDDQKGGTHLFAPENSRMIGFDRKIDRKGLGFAGAAQLGGLKGRAGAGRDEGEDEDDADARILSVNRPKLLAKPGKAKSSSFGVGVLNDTGSDDEDPYAIGPPIKYNRVIGGESKKRMKKRGNLDSTTVQKPSHTTQRFNSQKLTQRTATVTAGMHKCHDGRLPLHGFVLCMRAALLFEANQYLPPEVPPGWRSSKRATKFSDAAPAALQSTAEAAKASTLDPKSRAALLGEQQLSGKSVFDFLKPAARDKLVAASGKSDLPQARAEGAPAGFTGPGSDTRTLRDLVPALQKDVALAALQRGSRGWTPYSEDEEKRRRYRSFLSFRAGLDSALPDRPAGVSIDDWTKELREFAQAAEVFKPISALMATRFTSSSAAPKVASDAPDPVPAEPGKPLDPAEEAARIGMFGSLTRSRQKFHPTRLLCKRFGVKPPADVAADPDSAPSGGGNGDANAKRGDLVSQASINRMMMHANPGLPTFASGGVEGGQISGMASGAMRDGTARVDADVNEALEGQKPDESVFKSVFEHV